MQVETIVSNSLPAEAFHGKGLPDAQIVLYFISPKYGAPVHYLAALKKAYPGARLVGCTTGGEIFGDDVAENAAVSVALSFATARTRVAEYRVSAPEDSYAAGQSIGQALASPDLRLVFVLSEGLVINGSGLVQGLTASCPPGVMITGGLAGDGADFRQTGVGVDSLPESGKVAAVGFYGDSLRASCGSVGGWVNFGPERVITRARKNILYELDGKSALELYKQYLGEDAERLPGSGLLFPLSISPPDDQTHSIVRSVFGVDEVEKSLIFSDEIPQGHIARMMQGTIHNMVEGATQAAAHAAGGTSGDAFSPSVALLVSCIGRNLMMGQRVSSELTAVRDILGDIPLAGFYSYGEICPHPVTKRCDLHNQTMTITLLGEQA
ncbi:MAG: FIST N-terminal domain-containing protein [Alphaproteobacteria bacterium]|nr:FIST N-terminal domain-containing protein [Alphaproteobacteria bacterium]